MTGWTRICAALGCAAAATVAGCGGTSDSSERFEVETIHVGPTPEHLAYGFGALWVSTDGAVVRLDPKGGDAKHVSLDAGSGSIAAGEGAVWASQDRAVVRIDPRDRRRGAPVAVVPDGRDDRVRSIATGDGRVWAAGEDKLVQLDPKTGRTVGKPIPIGGGAKRVVVAGGGVWALIATGFEARRSGTVSVPDNDGTLVRVDPEARKVVKRLKPGKNPADVAAGGGSLWVVGTGDDGLRRLNPKTGSETGRASADSGDHVAADADSVWIADRRSNKLGRFEPQTGELSGGPFTIPASEGGNSAEVGEIALGAGDAWIASPIGPDVGRIAR